MKSLYKQLLINHFKNNQEKLDELIKKLSVINFYSNDKSGVERALKNTNGFDSKKAKSFQYFVTQLHFMFGVPLSDFEIDKTSAFYREISEKELERIKITTFGDFTKADQAPKAMKDYEFQANQFLTHLKKDCFIYDPLFRFQKIQKPSHAYLEINNKIYKKIVTRLEKSEKAGSPINYARFLAVPFRTFKYNQYKPNLPKKTEIVSKVLDLCPFPLFEHICECLIKFRQFEREDDPAKEKYNYGFYLASFPTRSYHYAILNGGSFCYTEHLKYNKSGIVKTNRVLVEENAGNAKTMALDYIAETDKLLKKIKHKLFRRDIQHEMDEYMKNPKLAKSFEENKAEYLRTQLFSDGIDPRVQKLLYWEAIQNII